MTKRICVITGSRAEYGLLFWLIKGLQESPEFQLQILATGMHLSPEFGLTYQQIEADGFPIDKKVEMLLSSDSPTGVIKSMGTGMIGYADALAELRPDLVVVLGDRFEIFAASSAAMILKIPIAHLHGGETTVGAFDEAIRHSITKMSHLHFTAAEAYKNRVIQLGEEPKRVFNVGGMGIDNIKKLKLLSREELEESLDFKLLKRNILITFHPVTLGQTSAQWQLEQFLQALDQLEGVGLIFTLPNADTDGRAIIQLIDAYVKKNPLKAIAYPSLGQLRYLSALSMVDGVAGNSSSGLLEAPSFQVGTVNIGERQEGRLKAKSVIDCGYETQEIAQAFDHLFSPDFQAGLQRVENPYGDGGAAERILEVLKETPLNDLLQKEFYDLKR